MWEQIRSNQRRSAFVVVAMGVLLIATGMAAALVLSGDPAAALFGGGLGLVLWFGLWIVSARNGDRVLLRVAGAREIEKADHPQLFNVVEEMAIAAQLEMSPRVFVVDDPSPNAFATGRDPRWAGVTVTTGLLRLLDRDGLQGVVAHEVGHIKNRDVALMTTAGVMAGAIVLVAEIGRRILWHGGGMRRSRTDNRGGGGAQALLLVASLLLLLLAPVFAQLIYFALSRRREFLADASGALFTRYPEGLAAALEQLDRSAEPLHDASRVTAPMYIVRPMRASGRRAASWFTTHPPLRERVAILRAMGGRADVAAYDRAFEQVRGGHVVGARTLGVTAALEARLGAEPETADAAQRARAASDAFLAGSGYGRRPCEACGAIFKVPPQIEGELEACLRCGAPLPGAG